MKEKDIKNIVITYEDGTSRELDKGMVVSTEEVDDELNVSMAMCHMNGKEVIDYMESIIMAYGELQGWNEQ